MTEGDRIAMCRGTLTSGIDLEEVRRHRDALAARREAMPAAVQAAKPEPMLSYIALGLVIGLIVGIVSRIVA